MGVLTEDEKMKERGEMTVRENSTVMIRRMCVEVLRQKSCNLKETIHRFARRS